MDDAPQRRRLLELAAGTEGGLAILAGWLGRMIGQPPLDSLRWEVSDVALGIGACLPMVVVFLLCVRWPLGPLRSIHDFSKTVLRPLFAPCTLIELALISLLAGVGEEMLFRGVMQGALCRWLGLWAGLAAASVVFGLAHPINLAYVFLVTLIGFYLGWVWIASDNLLVVIVAHAAYDFAALVYLVKVTP